MSSITEQFSAAGKAQLTAQLNLLNALASQAVHNAEQVIALNLNAGKASLTQSAEAARHLFDSKDPRSLFTSHSASLEPLLAYSRQLFSIVSTAQSELIKSAKEHLSVAGQPAPAAKAAKPAPALAIEAPAKAVAAAPVAAKPAPVVEAKPAAKEELKAEVKPEVKAEPKAEAKAAEVKAEVKAAEVKAAEVKAEVKAETKAEAETKAAPAKPAAKAASHKQADLLSTKTKK